MRKALLLTFALACSVWADTGFNSTIRVTETDNSPACTVNQVKVTAGTLTCNGQVATITTGGGGGGGSGPSGSIIAAPQFSLPYYSVQGTTQTLAAFPNVSLSTATGIVISTNAVITKNLSVASLAQVVATPTNDYTATSSATAIVTNCASACTITLPTSVGLIGTVYDVKINGAGTTSITFTSAQTADGSTTITPNPNQFANMVFRSDGSNWIIK